MRVMAQTPTSSMAVNRTRNALRFLQTAVMFKTKIAGVT